MPKRERAAWWTSTLTVTINCEPTLLLAPASQLRKNRAPEDFVCLKKPANVLLGSVVLMSRMGSIRVTTADGPMWSQAPHNKLQALLELLVEIEHLLAGCERQRKFFSWDHSGRPSP